MLDTASEAALLASYRLCWRVQCAGRLLGQTADSDTLGEGACAFLMRETGAADMAALQAHLAEATATATGIVERVLAQPDSAAGS